MQKTTFTEKLGYGVASLGDSVSYGFVGTFFLFFLTTVAGIAPAVAGAIVAIGSIWDAAYNPVMGFFADKVRTRFGRRRPVILIFSVFLAVTMFLMFTNIDIPMAVKPVYYGIMMLLFWSSFTGFFVPYCALGVDYAADYDERTSIRSFATFFNMIGTLFCMVMPSVMVEFLRQQGLSLSGAWSFTGAALSIITFVTILITVIASKNRDLPCRKEEIPEKTKKESSARNKNIIIDIFSEYIGIAKLKPVKYLIAASLCSLIGYTLIMSDMIYFLTYNKELSSVQISGCLAIRSILGILFIPPVAALCKKYDKRITLIGCYLIGAAGMISVKLLGIDGLPGSVFYIVFATFCTAIYWQIMPSIFYDVCEYDKLTTGKKREATILSFQGLVEAFAAGIGSQILGIILQMGGFRGDAPTQPAGALQWIENSTTLVPLIFFAVTILALYKYPLRRHHSQAASSNEK